MLKKILCCFALLSLLSCAQMNKIKNTISKSSGYSESNNRKISGFWDNLAEGLEDALGEEAGEVTDGLDEFTNDIKDIIKRNKEGRYKSQERLYFEITGPIPYKSSISRTNLQIKESELGGVLNSHTIRFINRKSSDLLSKDFEVIPRDEIDGTIKFKKTRAKRYINDFGYLNFLKHGLSGGDYGVLLIRITDIEYSSRGELNYNGDLKAKAKITLEYSFITRSEDKKWEDKKKIQYSTQTVQIKNIIKSEVFRDKSPKQKILAALIIQGVQEIIPRLKK